MKVLSYMLLAVLAITGCSNSNTNQTDNQPEDTIAVYYYMLRAKGNFNEYVEAMQSCDGTTDEYKNRMVAMLKQHHRYLLKEKKGVNHVEVIRHEMHDSNRMANVFLHVTYNDSSNEEIIMPLVLDSTGWRIR